MMYKAKYKVPLQLRGYSFDSEKVFKAREERKLLCLRMDTNYSCNLACKYCYCHLRQKEAPTSIEFSDAVNIIDQAHHLGLESIVFLGGEPLLYSNFWPLVEFTAKKNIIPVIFTNGILLSEDIAKHLYELGASIIVKFDGFEKTQESLTGSGTFKKIHSGFDSLLKSGFVNINDNITRLGAASCVCKINYREIPEIWRFLRDSGIFPNVEIATALSTTIRDLAIGRDEAIWLRRTLKEIDEIEFEIKWQAPYSSMVAHNCFIFLTGCHIRADMKVSLCPEMPPVTTLFGKSLSEILNSEPFTQTRQLDKHLAEPCSSCRFLTYCLGGCRSKAYYIKHSLFEPDPFCPFI